MTTPPMSLGMTHDDLSDLIDQLRGDEPAQIQNDVSTGLRVQILKALDERGRAQELVRQQYSGRYPFELLQNANDASTDTGEGSVCFLLTDGALIVADQGTGFGREQIRAIPRVGTLFQRPWRKAIGYKGLGFKSVGEISDRPQVVSKAASFGFDEAMTRKAVEDVVAESLDPTQRLPVYVFPFHVTGSDLGDHENAVRELRDRGFSTVLRFPFHSRATREAVAGQVRETIVPRLLLFLDATLLPGSYRCRERLRSTGSPLRVGLLYGDAVAGRRSRRTLARIRKALREIDRRMVDALGDAWRQVDEVHVAVAVRLDDDGRPVHAGPEPMHVYFPTEEATGLPVILQGDFALELDRRHASRTPETAPYNDWLASELGALVGNVAELLARRFPCDAAVVGAFCRRDHPAVSANSSSRKSRGPFARPSSSLLSVATRCRHRNCCCFHPPYPAP